jgi:hypothetical protein
LSLHAGTITQLRDGCVVVSPDYTRNAESFVVVLLLNTGRAQSGGVVGGDTVIIGIESFDKIFVELLVEQLVVGAVNVEVRDCRDDALAVMKPDKTSGRELGMLAGKGDVELALVVIVPLGGIVVYASNIDDNGAGLEELWVSGAD